MAVGQGPAQPNGRQDKGTESRGAGIYHATWRFNEVQTGKYILDNLRRQCYYRATHIRVQGC